jgi:hypothetical protein
VAWRMAGQPTGSQRLVPVASHCGHVEFRAGFGKR